MFISINLSNKETKAIKNFVKALGFEPNNSHDANEEFFSVGYDMPEEGAGVFKCATNIEMTVGVIDIMSKYAPTIKEIFTGYVKLCIGLFQDLDGLKKKLRKPETEETAHVA